MFYPKCNAQLRVAQVQSRLAGQTAWPNAFKAAAPIFPGCRVRSSALVATSTGQVICEEGVAAARRGWLGTPRPLPVPPVRPAPFFPLLLSACAHSTALPLRKGRPCRRRKGRTRATCGAEQPPGPGHRRRCSHHLPSAWARWDGGWPGPAPPFPGKPLSGARGLERGRLGLSRLKGLDPTGGRWLAGCLRVDPASHPAQAAAGSDLAFRSGAFAWAQRSCKQVTLRPGLSFPA